MSAPAPPGGPRINEIDIFEFFSAFPPSPPHKQAESTKRVFRDFCFCGGVGDSHNCDLPHSKLKEFEELKKKLKRPERAKADSIRRMRPECEYKMVDGYAVFEGFEEDGYAVFEDFEESVPRLLHRNYEVDFHRQFADVCRPIFPQHFISQKEKASFQDERFAPYFGRIGTPEPEPEPKKLSAKQQKRQLEEAMFGKAVSKDYNKRDKHYKRRGNQTSIRY
jgi:hypothetical protein